jgi:diapolycopene oxygenase
MSQQKKAVIIGAGLGGLSAAIVLAKSGFNVTLLEKNDRLGGKLNVLETEGFKFDLGPSIFSLPQSFRPLFEGNGKTLEDYIDLRRVDPQWRNFFEDGRVIDLWEQTERMREELAKLPDGARAFEDYRRFVEYSRAQYDVIEQGYLNHGFDHFTQFMRYYSFRDAMTMDWRNTMDGSIRKRVRDPYLRDIFAYFIKYVGSSANDAPGFMNLMPNIQLAYGLWYVMGGMYQFARAFERRMQELNVKVLLNHEVLRINSSAGRVHSVAARSANETVELEADYIVSNMEIIPASEKLLGQSKEQLRKLERFEPACSGIVVHLGLNRVYPQLAHHNFFYSKHQRSHFNRVFHDQKLPDDPTIYLVAPTRTDPSQAPPGCDNIKILPHIPYINDRNPYTREDCIALKNLCLDKLERMGLTDLRKHIIVEDFWTPFDIRERYNSNRGSIYGVVSDLKKNFAFKAPKQSKEFKNLYFVGGSVNPGGGMPMVSISGQQAARMIIEDAGGVR